MEKSRVEYLYRSRTQIRQRLLLWLASHDRRGGDIDLLERVRGDGREERPKEEESTAKKVAASVERESAREKERERERGRLCAGKVARVKIKTDGR